MLEYVRRPGGPGPVPGSRPGRACVTPASPRRVSPAAAENAGRVNAGATDIIDELRESLRPPRDFPNRTPTSSPSRPRPPKSFEIGWGTHLPAHGRAPNSYYSAASRPVTERRRRRDDPLGTHLARTPFSSTSFCKNFQDSPSHRIFGLLHETLNINKK